MLIFLFYLLIYSIHIIWWPKESRNPTARILLRGYHTFSYRYGWEDIFQHTKEMTLIEHAHSIHQCLQDNQDYYNNLCVYLIQHNKNNPNCILNGFDRCDGTKCIFMCLKFGYHHPFVFVENDTDDHQHNSAFQFYQSGGRGVIFKVDDPFTNSVPDGPFDFTCRLGYYCTGYTDSIDDNIEVDG